MHPQSANRKLSSFRMAVYDAVKKIPRGMVASYGHIARTLGFGSPRAVGGALAANPFAPEVPCHRVVAADGDPGGFFGERGPRARAKKCALLESEGVTFTGTGAGRRVARGCFIDPDRGIPPRAGKFSPGRIPG